MEQDLANVLFDKSRKPDEKLTAIIEKINDEYEYWDKVKYKNIPESCTSVQELWTRVKASRITTTLYTWEKYDVTFGLTNRMQRMCHEFDMNFGGSWGNSAVLSHENREQYLISSLMEEAIFSSQMEGAATTRKVAKEMLRKKMAPKDKSQQMIVNNYQTIRFIVENKNTPLTPGLVFHIHHLMTEKTLENPEDAGRLRRNNDVVVEDGITRSGTHSTVLRGTASVRRRIMSLFQRDGCQSICPSYNKGHNHPLYGSLYAPLCGWKRTYSACTLLLVYAETRVLVDGIHVGVEGHCQFKKIL